MEKLAIALAWLRTTVGLASWQDDEYILNFLFANRLRIQQTSNASNRINTLMREDWTTELHPSWYKDVTPMRFLILGSFPPHPKRRAYEFFYPNRRNRFWRILSELSGQGLYSTKEHNESAVHERYSIMQKLQVGVQNMGFEIQRRGRSALDANIKIVKCHDILSIINSHPELERILLPGFSAPESTARTFIKYLKDYSIEVAINNKIQQGTTFTIRVNDRLIECVVLNSTSPASKIKYETIRDQFREQLNLK